MSSITKMKSTCFMGQQLVPVPSGLFWRVDCNIVFRMSPLLRPLCRAQELCREFGVRATIGLALKKLVSPAARVGSVYLMECDLAAGLPKVKDIPGIIAREGFLEDIDLLDGIENDMEKKRDALDRFKRGDRWFIGVDGANGKLATFRWMTTAWE